MNNNNVRGTLVIIGGAEERTGKKEVLNKIMTANPKKSKPIVGLVSSATEFPNETAETYKKAFKDLGAKDFIHFDVRKHSEADTDKHLRAIEEVDIIFFSGGDQYRLVHILGETKLMNRIYERYHTDSIIVGGTSAGAACMSNPMIYDGDAEMGFLKGTIKVTAGFGLLPNCVIDTHFIARCRIGRLTQMIAMNPRLLGIGLDEDTGLLIKKRTTAEVIGSGGVIVLGATDARYNGISKAKYKEPFTISSVKMHVLTKGVKFNLEKRLMSHSIANTIYKV
jgi:cyanophycinase